MNFTNTTQALLKKLDAVELEVDSFSNNIGELAALSQGLIEREHFDSENIAKQQASIEGKNTKLLDIPHKKTTFRLIGASIYFLWDLKLKMADTE